MSSLEPQFVRIVYYVQCYPVDTIVLLLFSLKVNLTFKTQQKTNKKKQQQCFNNVQLTDVKKLCLEFGKAGHVRNVCEGIFNCFKRLVSSFFHAISQLNICMYV